MEELVTKTLRASPDLLGRFFKESRYSFAPRVQSAWRDNVQLVKKVRNHRLLGQGCRMVKWHSTDDPFHCANKATLRGPEIQCVIIIIIIIIIIEESCWVRTASALQIYEAQPEISSVFRTREFIPLPRLVAMIMVTSLPPVCSKTFFTAGLTVRGAHRGDPHNMHSVQSLSS